MQCRKNISGEFDANVMNAFQVKCVEVKVQFLESNKKIRNSEKNSQ